MKWKCSAPIQFLIAIILAQKIFCAALLFALPSVAPTLFSSASSIENRFRTWDTEHYLQIAAHGYTPRAGHCAFYPLWPFSMRVGSFLTAGRILVAGYLLANLCSATALLILYRVLAEKSGSLVATRGIILLLLYPGSVFFFFPYTESLFLLLVSVCLLSLQRQRYGLAAAISFLLPLARPVGIFIFPVLLWHAFRRRDDSKRWAICLAPLLGYLCYFGIMQGFTGNAFEGFAAQQQFPAQPAIGRILDVPGFLQCFADFVWSHDLLHSFVDRGFFLLFLCGLYWILRLDSVYFVYSIFIGLVPALSNSLMSYTRFLALVFPLFVVAAGVTFRRSWLFYALCTGLGIMQIYFLVRHITGQWAG